MVPIDPEHRQDVVEQAPMGRPMLPGPSQQGDYILTRRLSRIGQLGLQLDQVGRQTSRTLLQNGCRFHPVAELSTTPAYTRREYVTFRLAGQPTKLSIRF